MLDTRKQEILQELTKIRKTRGWWWTNTEEIDRLLLELVSPGINQDNLSTSAEVHLLHDAFKYLKKLDTPQAVQILQNYALGDYDSYTQLITEFLARLRLRLTR